MVKVPFPGITLRQVKQYTPPVSVDGMAHWQYPVSFLSGLLHERQYEPPVSVDGNVQTQCSRVMTKRELSLPWGMERHDHSLLLGLFQRRRHGRHLLPSGHLPKNISPTGSTWAHQESTYRGRPCYHVHQDSIPNHKLPRQLLCRNPHQHPALHTLRKRDGRLVESIPCWLVFELLHVLGFEPREATDAIFILREQALSRLDALCRRLPC